MLYRPDTLVRLYNRDKAKREGMSRQKEISQMLGDNFLLKETDLVTLFCSPYFLIQLFRILNISRS